MATGNSASIDSLELDIQYKATKAANQINKLAKALTNLKEAASGAELGQVSEALKNAGSSSDKATSSFGKFKKALTLGGALYSMKRAYNMVKEWVNLSMDYIENVNLFTVSMGKFADEAKEYAEAVSEVMGIDPSEWMRNQGVFMTLATGFGIVSDRAYIMSKNLTQLGYDISSFFNIDYAEAMQKLQSGIAGEIEPLRRLGYDISQAKLEATALSLGINKLVKDMTQAEKAELRYYAIMTQVTTVQGDMARTLEQPANQMRILKAQITQTARAIGNVFIPILNAVIPYIIAFFRVLRDAADMLADLVGFEMPEVDYEDNTFGEISSDMADATESAKKLNKQLASFDEINNITITDDIETNNGTGSGFDFELPEYDFIGDAIEGKVDAIYDQMKGIADFALIFLSVFAGAKIISGIKNISTNLSGLGSSLPLVGVATLVALFGALLVEDNKYYKENLAASVFHDTGVQVSELYDEIEKLYKPYKEYISEQDELNEKIKEAKADVEEYQGKVTGLINDLSNRDKIDSQDVTNLNEALDDLYDASTTLDSLRFDSIFSAIGQSIEMGIKPGQEALENLMQEFTQMQTMLGQAKLKDQTRYQEILAEVEKSGSMSGAQAEELVAISSRLGAGNIQRQAMSNTSLERKLSEVDRYGLAGDFDSAISAISEANKYLNDYAKELLAYADNEIANIKAELSIFEAYTGRDTNRIKEQAEYVIHEQINQMYAIAKDEYDAVDKKIREYLESNKSEAVNAELERESWTKSFQGVINASRYWLLDAPLNLINGYDVPSYDQYINDLERNQAYNAVSGTYDSVYQELNKLATAVNSQLVMTDESVFALSPEDFFARFGASVNSAMNQSPLSVSIEIDGDQIYDSIVTQNLSKYTASGRDPLGLLK